MPQVQKVKVCGLVAVKDVEANALLAEILAELKGPLTVQPGDAWEAIFTAALEAADISLDAETLEALENITVTVDTSAGPVEITGNVTVSNDGGPLDVNITSMPAVEISNFEELLSATLNVTLNGEELNVKLSDEQLEALIDIDDTDDDLRPVNVNCFNWKDGEESGMFIGWANAAEDGSFAGYTVVSGEAPPETATVTCDEIAVTSIQAVRLEPTCVTDGENNLWVYPVPMIDTGTGVVVTTVFLDEMGALVENEVKKAPDCDCPQPECCEEKTEE